MTKKIVLLSDGTGNSSAKAQKTNVWRLYEALDQSDGEQMAHYDDGVGTSSNRYLALAGGAFGWGLKRNVLDLYKFVCRNYEPGDEIYGFGFSRGAFTIRVLVGLIASEGLVTFGSEEELARNALAAYRHYRSKRFPSWSPVVLAFRWLRDTALAVPNRLKGYPTYEELAKATESAGRKNIRIKFLGLWDTVEAYGIPILELKRGIDWVLWPMMFGDRKLSPLVDRACHALALDDERTTFHPILWDEEAEAEAVARGEVPAGRITQVWFAGVHSNVGGGYPEDQVSLVSLEWMMHEAMANGLAFETDAVQQVSSAKSPYARLYDSRAGFAAYYRYSPRSIPILRHGTDEIRPIVHNSVVLRMVYGSDRYAPISLPPRFWVLAPDGNLLAMEGFAQELQLDATKLRAASIAMDTQTRVQRAKSKLQKAMGLLRRPEQETVSIVWDTVWWRRTSYFLTVTLTAIMFFYPWLGGMLARGMHSALGDLGDRLNRWLETGGAASRPILASVVDALSGFVPGYARPWTETLERHPVEFSALSILLLLSLYKSTLLQTQIKDRAWLAWHGAGALSALGGRAQRRPSHIGSLTGLVLAGALMALSILGEWSRETQAELTVLTAILFLYLLWRYAETLALGRPRTGVLPKQPPTTFGLILARKIRKNKILQGLSRWSFQRAVPIGFALGVLAVGLFGANRILFDAASAAGVFCDGANPSDTFATDALCTPTTAELEEGHRYRIEIDTQGDWFDRAIRTDVAGHSSSGLWQYLGVPLKRWWTQSWFKPILRIGPLGNDEYVLEPVSPLEAHTYCTEPARYGGVEQTAASFSLEAQAVGDNSQCDAQQSFLARQLCACKPCLRQEPVKESVHSLRAKIIESAADELMRCSPTPESRRTLSAEIKAKSSGVAFVYVNDAVVMLPFLFDAFYANNRGVGTVKITDLGMKPGS
jgi:uncharacterized protein (DUF2235 family)